MSERERRLPNLTPLPFALPPAFAERRGDACGRRLVGIYWGAGDAVAFDDGVHYAAGLSDRHVYWELTRQPQVRGWLREHEINLGNSEEPPSHWLLVDRLTNRSYVSPVRAAIQKVKTQRLEE